MILSNDQLFCLVNKVSDLSLNDPFSAKTFLMNEDAIISQICFPTAVNNQTDFNNLQNKYDETMPEEPQPNVHE